MNRLLLRLVPALGLLAIGCKRSPPPSDAPLHVAAAADLAEAFPEVGAAFEKATARKVVFSFGASGMLEQQIAHGAPFDVFAAANASFVDDAIAAGACDADTKTPYAEGRIVIWTRGDGSASPASLADLARPEVLHVAIANPEHAPYGRAAKEALVRSGVWDAVSRKVVYGENIQQTLQFAQSGNADVAIVAQSLAGGSGGRAVPIDPALYAPLVQAIVVCHGGAAPRSPLDADARRFTAFVTSGEGRSILKRFGFATSPR
jgi:molybdate transport system substrate-binding protein